MLSEPKDTSRSADGMGVTRAVGVTTWLASNRSLAESPTTCGACASTTNLLKRYQQPDEGTQRRALQTRRKLKVGGLE